MKAPFFLVAAIVVCVAACGQHSEKTGQATNSTSASSSPLTAPVDYLGAVGKAQQNAIKSIDTSYIKSAIQMFQVEQGRNPKDLNELVEEKYLGRLPDAPYGMKLQYDAASGVVTVVKK